MTDYLVATQNRRYPAIAKGAWAVANALDLRYVDLFSGFEPAPERRRGY